MCGVAGEKVEGDGAIVVCASPIRACGKLVRCYFFRSCLRLFHKAKRPIWLRSWPVPKQGRRPRALGAEDPAMAEVLILRSSALVDATLMQNFQALNL